MSIVFNERRCNFPKLQVYIRQYTQYQIRQSLTLYVELVTNAKTMAYLH